MPTGKISNKTPSSKCVGTAEQAGPHNPVDALCMALKFGGTPAKAPSPTRHAKRSGCTFGVLSGRAYSSSEGTESQEGRSDCWEDEEEAGKAFFWADHCMPS